MAAALVLKTLDVFPEEQTPPRSPDKTDFPPIAKRQDVESIKIYADAELQALFANIEKEMERMVNNGSPSSSPEPYPQVC
jgi:hypothetical protein